MSGNLISVLKARFNKRKMEQLVSYFKRVATISDDFETILGSTIHNQSWDPSHIIIGSNCRMYGALACSTSGRIEVGNYTSIMSGVIIRCTDTVKIGSFTGIAENTSISDNNNHPTDIEGRIKHRIRVAPSGPGYGANSYGWELAESAPIIIGDGVWIGGSCTILKGVTIGDGAIVARASVVTKDVEPFTVVAGNPAKKVKQLPIPDMSVLELAQGILNAGNKNS